jgi:hypothetical protein
MPNQEHAKRLIQTESEPEVTTFLDELSRTYDIP